MKKSSFQLQQQEFQTEQQKKTPSRHLNTTRGVYRTSLPLNSPLGLPSPPQYQNLIDIEPPIIQSPDQQYQKFLQNRIVKIEGPQLVTQNVIKSYKLYKIKTHKNNQNTVDSCVNRRFSDFQFLQKQLIQNYGGYIIPILPQKNIWTNLNMQSKQQIQNRVINLQKYLQYLLSHTKIKRCLQLKYFLFQNQIKFSQLKGQYFQKIKTQQKIKSIASNAIHLSKDIFSKFFSSNDHKNQQQNQLIQPNTNDLKLIQFQKQITDLIKVINILRGVVENSVLQMKTIGLIMPQSTQASFNYHNIMNDFQDLCKYIFSCNQALQRRYQVRLEIDHLNIEYEALQKKIRTNPRSQQVDILRNKLSKATQKCQKWTSSLLQQLQQSISVGKSMIQNFINCYSQKKQKFYNL